MSTVTSKDGTPIAYDRTGSGPAVIVVDGALCSRAFGPSQDLAKRLAEHFTVFTYDRRGRGESGDTQPWAKAREMDDLAALLAAAGGHASLVAVSSGAALALEAAASGLPIDRVVAYEPPFMVDDGGRHARANHEGRLREILAGGRRGAAVKYFMRDMVGVPAPFVLLMQCMPWVWRKLAAVAHTLPYDAAVMGNWQIPHDRLGAIARPTLVMHGGKTDEALKKAAVAVAAAIPGARHRVLDGQTHNVKADVFVPVAAEFLRA